MIPRQELHELASFWAGEGDAISFYFATRTPTELAHREEPILTKEKIQEVFGTLQGKSPSVRSDLDRLLETSIQMKGNHAQAKVVFACAREKFWREYDLPGNFPLRLDAGESFAIAPLAASPGAHKRYCIALTDRNRSRLLLLQEGRIVEDSKALDEELDPEFDKVRTTGTGGSSHVERQREEMARKHFQFLASHLLHFYEQGNFDALLFGCRDAMWAEIESTLHNELRRVLIGRFRVDPGLATAEEVQKCAEELIGEREHADELALLESAVGGAAADALGAVGLPGVVRSLEKGEIQTLLWTPQANSESRAISACTNCGHLRLGKFAACDLCGQKTRQYSRGEEALFRRAVDLGLEVRQVTRATLPPPDEFAAVLRFRSDHSTPQALAS